MRDAAPSHDEALPGGEDGGRGHGGSRASIAYGAGTGGRSGQPLRRLTAALAACGLCLLFARAAVATPPATGDAAPPAQPATPPPADEPTPDAEAPADDTQLDTVALFRMAENMFRYQDYERAASLLWPLLYPTVKLESRQRRLKAREYLASSYWWTKKTDRAREEFTALLIEEPARSLDPFYYPAPLVRFVDELRAELRAKGALRDDGEGGEAAPQGPVPWTVNLLPFGIPQFTQRRPLPAWLLLVGQVSGLGTNVTSALLISDLRGTDGLYSRDDAATARSMRTVWWISGGVFAALYLYGVVDGLLHAPKPNLEPVGIRRW